MGKNKVVTVYKNPFTIIASIFAVMCSWYFNQSVLWAIFHFIFGWLYLLYCLILGRFADGGFMEIINHYF
jgi:hypothetical protein